MSKTVLVTGASGFIGKFVVPALAKQGWQVRAAARDPNSILAKPGIEIVAMPDLKDAVDWAPLLDGVSHVLHLAGIAHAPGMLPDDAYSGINAQSVGALAKAAHERVLANRSDRRRVQKKPRFAVWGGRMNLLVQVESL